MSGGKFTEGSRRAVEAGRRGGKASSRSRRKWLEPDEMPPLVSVEAAQVWLDSAGRACAEGRLTSSQANSITKAASEYLKSLETATMLDELEELRALLKQRAAA